MHITAKAAAFLSVVTASVGFAGVPAHAATTRVVQQGQSIQAAIDASQSGDTVIVDGGRYTQDVTITKSGITLLGRGALLQPPTTTVHTPCSQFGGKAAAKNDVGICLLGHFDSHGNLTSPLSNVVVGGFTVRNFSMAGIWMVGGKNVVVRDNLAENDGGYGIARFVSTGGRVEDNDVTGNAEAGIYWGDSPQSTALVQGNHAYDNGDFGIFIRDSSHGIVQDNISEFNCVGIITLRTGSTPVTDWTVQNNISHDNNAACPAGEGPPLSGIGIAVAGADHVNVLNNNVSHNAPSGPSIASGGVVIISTKSQGGGVESNIGVHHNVISNNKPANITWDHKGTNVSLTNNSCTPAC